MGFEITSHCCISRVEASTILYANSGYLLLARIVEVDSGKPLGKFVEECIFKPLGMNDTKYVEDFTSLIPHRAEGYVAAGPTWASPRSRFAEIGPSGMVTTSTDLLKWLNGFYAEKLCKELVELVTTNGFIESGDNVNYGYGTFIQQYRGVRLFQHGGARPGYVSNLAYAPELDIGISVLCNLSSMGAIAASNQILEIVAGDAIQPQIEITVHPEVSATLTGSYVFSDSAKIILVTQEGSKLFAQATG